MSVIPASYYAVIFTSVRTDIDEGYGEWDEKLFDLVKNMAGYLGHESYGNSKNEHVTISYWRDLDAISRWHDEPTHRQAQELGRLKWYKNYRIRVCKVERDYEFER